MNFVIGGALGSSWSLAFPDGALELLYPWLFLLWPLPLLLTRFAPPHRSRFEAIHVPLFTAIAGATGSTPSPGAVVLRRGWPERIFGLTAWTLLLLALARPQWVDPPVERIEPGRDLLLAVDISQSMAERDFAGLDGKPAERLSAIKQVLDGFIAGRTGDRIGLIVFGDGAYLHVPLTLDHALLRRQLGELQVGLAGPRTRIGDGLGLAVKLLDESQAKHKLVIVLSDGNDTGSKVPPATAASMARQRGVTLHAVAIGDPQTRGNEAVQLATLQELARLGGGRFALGTDQRQLEAIYAQLDALEQRDFKTLSYRARHALFHWPLGAALALFLLGQLTAALGVAHAHWRERRSTAKAAPE